MKLNASYAVIVWFENYNFTEYLRHKLTINKFIKHSYATMYLFAYEAHGKDRCVSSACLIKPYFPKMFPRKYDF